MRDPPGLEVRTSLSHLVGDTEGGDMGFASRCGGFLGIVLSCALGLMAQTSVTVVVNDSVKVKPAVLHTAEQEATRLFRSAGISILWLHCAKTDACRRPLLPNEYVLHIVPTGNTKSDFVYGVAFLGEDGRGRYSDVFFDRIRMTPGNIDVGRLLGVVAAHELGHLLLGSTAHSTVGIMEPVWEEDCVRRVGMGALHFTPEQARLMRQRIGLEEPAQVEASSRQSRRF